MSGTKECVLYHSIISTSKIGKTICGDKSQDNGCPRWGREVTD